MAALLIAALALAGLRHADPALQAYRLPFGMTAMLPAKPEEDKEDDKGSDRKSFVSAGEDGVFYVSSTPVDPKERAALPPDQQIAVYLMGAMQSFEGSKLSSYSDVLLDGWPGVEVKVDDTKGGKEIWSRIYAMNGDIVEIGTVYEKDDGPPSGAQNVLDSLKQDSPKYGPVTSAAIPFVNVEPDGASFRMDFPQDAHDEPVNVGSDDEKLLLHHYSYSRDMRMFDLSYLVLPDEATKNMPSDGPEQLRENALNALLESMHAEKDSSSTEQRDGNDWLTAQFHVKDFGVGRADVLFANGKVYTLVAFGPEPWMDSTEFKRFFDSFELKTDQAR